MGNTRLSQGGWWGLSACAPGKTRVVLMVLPLWCSFKPPPAARCTRSPRACPTASQQPLAAQPRWGERITSLAWGCFSTSSSLFIWFCVKQLPVARNGVTCPEPAPGRCWDSLLPAPHTIGQAALTHPAPGEAVLRIWLQPGGTQGAARSSTGCLCSRVAPGFPSPWLGASSLPWGL